MQVSRVSISRVGKWSGQDPPHCTLKEVVPTEVGGLVGHNDLDNVDRLEEYINESAVIHIFYSENYFRSFNCRREFYKAMALEKPIIVVYEGDNGVVKKMKDECAKYCTEKYRNEGIDINHILDILTKDPICILKAGAFSAETLKLVYLSLLKSLPFYRDSKRRDLLAKGLRIPRELAEVSLTSQTRLMVCEENTGAYDLAKEIQDLCSDIILLEALHDVYDLRSDVEEKRRINSISDVFLIKKGNDDIEEGMSLCQGTLSDNLNEAEALVRNGDDAYDDLSEDSSRYAASLDDLSSFDDAKEENLLKISSVVTSADDARFKEGEKVSKGEHKVLNSVNISSGRCGGDVDDDLSLASNTYVLSPEEKTQSAPPKAASNSISGNTRDNLTKDENYVGQGNIRPVIDRRMLLLYLNKHISLDEQSKTLDIVKMAKEEGIVIILVHEQDSDKGGCSFSLNYGENVRRVT